MAYDSSQLTLSALQRVRFYLGGASADSLISDNEINFALSLEPNEYAAAAMCADSLFTRYGTTATTIRVGPLSKEGGTQFENWKAVADHLRMLAKQHAGIGATDMLVGATVAEKVAAAGDTTYPQPWITPGMQDNPESDGAVSDNWWMRRWGW